MFLSKLICKDPLVQNRVGSHQRFQGITVSDGNYPSLLTVRGRGIVRPYVCHMNFQMMNDTALIFYTYIPFDKIFFQYSSCVTLYIMILWGYVGAKVCKR
jgi:hypothetical protein